jgi:signal transduction histidine kinase
MEDLDLPSASVATTLAAAIGRVSERVAQLSKHWAASRDEFGEAFSHIARQVEGILAGRDLPDHIRVSDPLLHQRLAEVLRVELLRGARPGEPSSALAVPQTVLDLVWALEEYRLRLWPAQGQELAARLAEPDGLKLLVEVAHDLRSPLNSILFLSEVLRSGQSGPVTPLQRTQLGLIYGAAMGMISVANDIMDRAGGTSDFDDDPSPFSVCRLFDSVHELVRPVAEEKGIALEFVPLDYDPCVGRPAPLGRVLLNLTTNALKFTDEGTVTVGARRLDRSKVEFYVRDTGRGIPANQQHHLFQPFQRAVDRSGHFFAQAGLGLSIARRLVQAMGSELGFETELSKGTVFRFTLDLPSA